MITLILIIASAIALYWLITEYTDMYGGVLSCVYLVAALTVFFVTCANIGPSAPPATETRQEIAVLKDHNGIQGSWSLFGGSIDGEPAYHYYSVDEEGGLHLEEVLAENVTIFEDSETGGYLATSSQAAIWMTPWSISFVGDFSNTSFHVPPGTVQRGFALDGE